MKSVLSTKQVLGTMKMKPNRFDIVATVSGVTAIAHATGWVEVDAISLSLFAAAACAFVFRDMDLTGGLKRLKVGYLEAEFHSKIERLEEKVVVAEHAVSQARKTADTRVPNSMDDTYRSEYAKILESNVSGDQKILLGALLAEKMISSTLEKLNLSWGSGPSAMDQMALLQAKGLVTREEVDAFLEFQKVRNFLVHDASGELSDMHVARLLDLLWRLVCAFG